jgi:hypothetical protein
MLAIPSPGVSSGLTCGSLLHGSDRVRSRPGPGSRLGNPLSGSSLREQSQARTDPDAPRGPVPARALDRGLPQDGCSSGSLDQAGRVGALAQGRWGRRLSARRWIGRRRGSTPEGHRPTGFLGSGRSRKRWSHSRHRYSRLRHRNRMRRSTTSRGTLSMSLLWHFGHTCTVVMAWSRSGCRDFG